MDTPKYLVLKAFGNLKEGDVVSYTDFDETMNEEIFAEKIRNKELELILESVPDVYDGPIGKYKVVGEIFPLNDDGSQQEKALELGSIHELPVNIGDDFIGKGLMEEVVEDESTGTRMSDGAQINPSEAKIESTDVSTAPTKTLDGKVVIGESTREVNGKEYHHIRLEDGTTQDLTDVDYEEKVITQTN